MKETGIVLLDEWLDHGLDCQGECEDTTLYAADILEIQQKYPELIPALAAAKDSDLADANVRAALRKTVEELIELGDDEIDIYEEV